MSGDRVTFGRVCVLGDEPRPATLDDAGEVRIAASFVADDARARVREAAAVAGTVPLTGFSLAICSRSWAAITCPG
jgi:hypothetical protein